MEYYSVFQQQTQRERGHMVAQGDMHAIIRLVENDFSGGKRLYEASFDAVDECGHRVLSPIHVIYAAVHDDHAPIRVKQLIERHGFTPDVVDAVLALYEDDSTREHVLSVGRNASMGADAVRMYDNLGIRFMSHVNGLAEALLHHEREPSHWNFYVTQFLLAMESDAVSIGRLHTLALQSRS